MRFNFRLNGAAAEFMEKLSDKFSIQPKDAVLDSLAILNIVADEIERNGGRLGIQGPDGEFTAIVTPALAALQKGGRGIKHTKEVRNLKTPKLVEMEGA